MVERVMVSVWSFSEAPAEVSNRPNRSRALRSAESGERCKVMVASSCSAVTLDALSLLRSSRPCFCSALTRANAGIADVTVSVSSSGRSTERCDQRAHMQQRAAIKQQTLFPCKILHIPLPGRYGRLEHVAR
jgi:hypothetical protein